MLGAEGWAVAVHYHRSRQDAESVVGDIVAAGGRAAAGAAHLAREAGGKKLVPRAGDALGPPGCLVNNAAGFENDLALSATRESWGPHLETNLRAALVLMPAI